MVNFYFEEEGEKEHFITINSKLKWFSVKIASVGRFLSPTKLLFCAVGFSLMSGLGNRFQKYYSSSGEGLFSSSFFVL
jgi:hypothetical protein